MLSRRAAVAGIAVAIAAACAPTTIDAPEEYVDVPDELVLPETAPPADGGSLTAYGCTIQSLNPQQTRDTCSGRVISQLFAGLVELDPASGEPRPLVAASIDTDDAVVWDIELAEGWTFHDGEPVTARSFADAWNFAAIPANDVRNREFFADIAGYDAVQQGLARSLHGVEVVDELTLRVTLDQPFAPFLAKLADSTFAPLPTIAYEDMGSFGRAPVGNGRYVLTTFDPDRQVVLTRYDEYGGNDPALPREVTFIIYTGDAALETALQDVQAGALDILDNLPAGGGATLADDFSGGLVERPTSSFTFLGLPLYVPEFDDLDVRIALSLAIDREAIIDEVFNGSVQPARAIIPPVLEAHRPDACEFCRFDPEAAVERFEAAGGISEPVTVLFNADGGHEPWVTAVAQQWRDVLGIESIEFETMDLSPYVQHLTTERATGPFRLGWALSYLSPEYALSSLFRAGGAYNFFGYDNAAFDEALNVANASVPADADEQYQAAEDVVLTDMPLIPLWYSQTAAAHGPRVANVIVDATSMLRVELVEVVG
ncbi:MAG: ABC transporter substrate-binding protein [Nitriliruptoraceae bacterium]